MIVYSMSKYSQLCASIMATPVSLASTEESRSPSRRLKSDPTPLAAAQKAGRNDG